MPSQQDRAGEDADGPQPSAVSSRQWDSQGSDAAAAPAAAPQHGMLWTRSEGSLSDDPEAAYEDGEWADSAASDAETYSEVTASLGGDATDADAASDGGPWQHAKGGPHSSTAAAVLGTSLWAEPATSRDALPLPPQANGLRRHPSEASAEHDASAPGQHAAEPSGHPETDAAPQPAPPPPPLPAQVSGADGIMVPPELLVRYYQLEAWAAEYYAWFCRTQQHRQ